MNTNQFIMNTLWRKNKSLFLGLMLLLSAFGSVRATDTGPDKQYYLIHDFEDDWQIYNDRKKSYIPYIDELHGQYASHTLFFEIDNYRGYRVLIYSEDENYLFINGSLRRKVVPRQWTSMSIDSLYTVYKKPIIFLTLYGSKNISGKRIQVGYQKVLGQKNTALATALLTAQAREISTSLNYTVLVSLLVLAFFVYLYNNYNRAIEYLFSLRQLFATLTRDNNFLVNRPLGSMNIALIIFLSILVSFCFVLLRSEGVMPFGNSVLLKSGNNTWVHLNNFFRVSVLVFAAYLLKYSFINAIGGIFGTQKATNLHYFKILQTSILFFSLVLLVFLCWFPSQYERASYNILYLTVPLLIFYLGRVSLLFFTIKANITIKNLYLFSYLCIVEILPIVIGINFIA